MKVLPNLEAYDIILGSGSPRRKELLSALGLKFRIETSNKEEKFPENLSPQRVPVFLSEMKAKDIVESLTGNYLLITADTVVIYDNQILGKPQNITEAKETLILLAGNTHSVITGITITTKDKQYSFTDETLVSVAQMSEHEIEYYVTSDNVLDKAGSYGIQDWLGIAKISSIVGSYYNVMGMPTDKLYHVLQEWT